MKFLLLFFLLLPETLKAEICEITDSGLPNSFLSDFRDIDEQLRLKLLRRELTSDNVKILDISSNFVPPGKETTYFARMYYNKSDHTDIRLRDTTISEKYFEKDAKLPQPEAHYGFKLTDFLPPKGQNFIEAPGTYLNVSTDPKFSIEKGGQLNIKFKLPFKDERVIKVVMRPTPNGGMQNFILAENGQLTQFDKMYIEAPDVFGKPNILRGIKDVQFQRGGKSVYTLKPE